jgi:hypothetical protein
VVVDVQGWIAAPVLTVTPQTALTSERTTSPLTSTDGEQALKILK